MSCECARQDSINLDFRKEFYGGPAAQSDEGAPGRCKGRKRILPRALFVPVRRIQDVLRVRHPIDADTDLRLARYFRVSPGFLLGLQAGFKSM